MGREMQKMREEKNPIYFQVNLGCHCTYIHETNIHSTAEFHETHVCLTNFCKERLNRISRENSASPFFAYSKSRTHKWMGRHDGCIKHIQVGFTLLVGHAGP